MTTIYLVTGFLGAGKTTFLRDRLAAASARTGVLVNDFGKINFDGLQMQRQGLEMVELSNGSIFCACLKDAFVDGLVHLVEQKLDEIYIESSGLADPSDMGRVLASVDLRKTRGDFRYGGAICLVDSLFFPKVLPKMVSVERQIRHSHLVLVNKTDLIDAEQLAHVHAKVLELNPRAQLIDTTYGQVDFPAVQIDVFPIADEETTNKISTRNKNLVLHFIQVPERHQIEAFLAQLGGLFFRIKGVVKLAGDFYQIDQVNQQLQIRPADPHSALVAELASAGEAGELVCLTSQGLESISHLARLIDQHLPGFCRLEM